MGTANRSLPTFKTHFPKKKKKKKKKTATDKTASNPQYTIAPTCTVAGGRYDVLQGSGIKTVQAQEAQGRTQQIVNKQYNPPYASLAAMFKTAVRHFDCVINRGC